MRLAAAGKLSLFVDQRILFLDPTNDSPAVLSGRVRLRLTSGPRTHLKLKVRLRGHATVLNVARPTLEMSLDLGEGRTFEAGDNDVGFSFSVPQNTAPTEGCPHGIVQYFLDAVAYGLGALGADLRQDQEIDCHANPGGSGPPPPLECHIEAFAPALGPVRISAYSHKLTLATMMLVDVRLPEPAIAQTISVVIAIEQTWTITPHEGLRQPQVMPAQTHELRRAHLHLTAGSVGRLRELVRLPRGAVDKNGNGDKWQLWSPIRASTLAASDTPIRAAHRLVVELEYRDADGVERVLSCGHAIEIAHCTYLSASCQLPEYAEVGDAAKHAWAPPSDIGFHYAEPFFCLCQITDESMLAEEGVTLLQQHADRPDRHAAPIQPKRRIVSRNTI